MRYRVFRSAISPLVLATDGEIQEVEKQPINFKVTESGGLVVTSRTLIREVPGSIPGPSYLGGGSVVVPHHQANAGVDPI